jgi:ubiquinone/menaquinone biosynthesis C-methylase UbiE
LTLNDPTLVRREYEREQRLETRRALWDRAEGPDPSEIAFEAVAAVEPRRVLEVGAGPGEFAARLTRDLDAEVSAVDISPRMVELARARGVAASIGDVQQLELEDASFDCAIAAWMLYHVPDLDRGLSELARVLRPGGRLVAITNSERNLWELWSLFGADAEREHAFSCENGTEPLRRHFRRVKRRRAVGGVTIATREHARRYVSASVTRPHLAARLPEEGWPLRATRSACVFVAHKARS